MADPFLPPDLDALCSRHFRWRQFIECGDTFERLARVAPDREAFVRDIMPREPGTWEGIARLAQELLDPLVVEFGEVRLTYAFAGPRLFRHIKRGIAPKLDQHVGAELNSRGARFCARGGQAVDLYTPAVDSRVLGTFLHSRGLFDRMYFYSSQHPLHVSLVKSHPARLTFSLTPSVTGRRIPRRIMNLIE